MVGEHRRQADAGEAGLAGPWHTPDLMGQYAVLARDAGVRIIGGCCGTMPEHLKAMRRALEETPPGPRPSLDTISEKLGGFSSASDGTGDDANAPRRERTGRRRS